MRRSWNEQLALKLLKQWINEGNWKGTTHFRKYNSSLYEYIYRMIGLDAAFEKLGLDYEEFKKSVGKNQQQRDSDVVIGELHALIKSNQWKGIRHLQLHNSSLYRELSRIGFEKAFEQLGLDYREFRYTIWSEEDILTELKTILDNGKWQGALHLKEHNSSLYNAIVRHIGFEEAFRKIGFDYDTYKYLDLSSSIKK